MSEVTVHVRGPIFDGRAAHAVTEFLQQARRDVAAQAVSDLHKYMDEYFKHPTPYYETQITVDHRGNSEVVNDRGIIYGPWLAGTGSRNRTTRFKGYAHWRRTMQDLQTQAPELAERALQHHLKEMQ